MNVLLNIDLLFILLRDFDENVMNIKLAKLNPYFCILQVHQFRAECNTLKFEL
jgi:hypothetical protein